MALSTDKPPQAWVPVEHRWFGLDRRTFKPGLISLVVAAVLIYGLPALNSAIPWHNEIEAGQVLDLGNGATAVPPVGWQIQSGTLTGGNATSLHVLLATGGATIELDGTPYDGSASAFLDQVERSDGDRPGVNGNRGTLTTAAGLVGVVDSRTSPSGDGVDAAFKMATGSPETIEAAPALLVRVRTAAGQFEHHQDEVAALLRSITPGDGPMTGVAVSDGKAAQLTAIEESGWGQPFQFVQPHNLSFWVYLLGVGGGALTMLRYFGAGAAFYTPALAGGALLFGLYLVPWLLLLRHHNRFTAQPAGLLATGFVWGGVAATFWIAMPANTALLEIWTKVGGPSFGANWGAGLTAPINEEWGKALGLVLLIGLAPRLVRSAYDGFIIGAFIGLGFQVFEDVLYVYNGATQLYGVDQFGSSLRVFVVRGASGIVSHALFSAIFCAGLMWVLGRTRGERNVVRGVLTMLTAMVFHFAWDDMVGLSGGGLAAAGLPFVIAAIELTVLFYVLRHAARQERVWTRALLTPELTTGAIDPPLLDAVSGLRKDRKAYRKHLHSRRTARHLLEAATDLARELAHAGGTDSPGVTHARDEILRLRNPT